MSAALSTYQALLIEFVPRPIRSEPISKTADSKAGVPHVTDSSSSVPKLALPLARL
jgi:hypothetical protein